MNPRLPYLRLIYQSCISPTEDIYSITGNYLSRSLQKTQINDNDCFQQKSRCRCWEVANHVHNSFSYSMGSQPSYASYVVSMSQCPRLPYLRLICQSCISPIEDIYSITGNYLSRSLQKTQINDNDYFRQKSRRRSWEVANHVHN